MTNHPALERAREGAQVTPEERAELAERAHQNRIDEIMSAHVVRKVNENALQSQPTNRPETEQELKNRMCHRAADLACEIMRSVRSQSTTTKQIKEAITPIISEIMLVSIANQIKRAELERRIEALEREMKPRHRVKGISERVNNDARE